MGGVVYLKGKVPPIVRYAAIDLFALFAVGTALAAPVDYNREIRPILSDKCFSCHGPDEKQRQAGLRLDTMDGAARVVQPGTSANSRLFQRINAEKPALRMPPTAAGPGLTKAQIDTIARWIDQGARSESHWSYVPPRRPSLPETKNRSWPRNALDRFVLARLEKEGLRPSPEAAKATLLRRVTFDLTGLPPAPAEVDAFLGDKSPGAYERVVDRLLSSPRYGERMAMQWLDLARYADTHGFHIDSHRDMWPWRDWVISAFNKNLPFDRFTIWQLAGDLLPEATREQKLATGFNRNHMINFEGGAIPEEYQTEYVVDRVDTTATVWMGMTMGCARCHDHKYDPIKQKDFYRFFAFFNTIPERGLDGRTGNAEPFLPLPTPPEEARLESLTAQIIAREESLTEEATAAAMFGTWEKTRAGTLPEPPRAGLTAHYELDGHLADTSGFYRHANVPTATYGPGQVGQAATFDGEEDVTLGHPLDSKRPFSLALWINSSALKETAVLRGGGFELGYDESEVLIAGLKRGARIVFRVDALGVRTKERFAQRVWSQVTVNYDGSGSVSGLKLFVDAKPVEVEAFGGLAKAARPYKGQLDDVRFYNGQLDRNEIATLAIHLPVRSALLASTAKLSKAQRKDRTEKLREYFLTYDAPESLRALYAELKELEAGKAELDRAVPSSMVMKEMPGPRDTWVLGRGDYRNHGEKVTPGVPASLPPLPAGAPQDRLGLALWLTSPAHPLTARVAVNRYWQMYFGTGIVETAEDFGSQGGAPSHPELLDWLATEFVGSKWDVRAMQRLIVTSATYRQSSRIPPELLELDPQNRLLARGPRFRLPAEMVRDSALAASGLLVEQLGGRSVNPYQPKGLWEELAFGDVFSAQTYVPGTGSDLYRRSMYTFWKRTSPPPSLTAFDAPDREKCTARRARTNTPLQALILMNDPTYVEAARGLAQRMMTEGGPDAGSRINYGFRLAASRKPEPREAQIFRDMAEVQTAEFRKDKDSAMSLLGVGESKADPKLDRSELAAWTTVASMILNLDETITKE